MVKVLLEKDQNGILSKESEKNCTISSKQDDDDDDDKNYDDGLLTGTGKGLVRANISPTLTFQRAAVKRSVSKEDGPWWVLCCDCG